MLERLRLPKWLVLYKRESSKLGKPTPVGSHLQPFTSLYHLWARVSMDTFSF